MDRKIKTALIREEKKDRLKGSDDKFPRNFGDYCIDGNAYRSYVSYEAVLKPVFLALNIATKNSINLFKTRVLFCTYE